MGIKTSLVSWYIRNIWMSKAEDFGNPGYLITKLSKDGPIAYLRDVLFSESLISNIETEVTKKYSDLGGNALYSAGKKSNYIYATFSDLIKISNTKPKDFEEFSQYYITYLAGTYASEMSRKLDLKSKSVEITARDYIVCSKNGHGYIFTEGGIAGIWAYSTEDPSAECTHYECQGKGAPECRLICAPARVLSSKGLSFFREQDMPNITTFADYASLNAVRAPKYAKRSLKDLIDIGIFSYHNNKLSYHGERYFEADTHYTYLIEKELDALKGGRKLLFDICFDFGKNIASRVKESDYNSWTADYLSALGWGDIMVTDKTIIALSYPWTIYSETSDFTIFRGLVSGLISGFSRKRLIFKKTNSSVIGGKLDVEFTA